MSRTTKPATAAAATTAPAPNPSLLAPGTLVASLDADTVAMARFAHAEMQRRGELPATLTLEQWLIDALHDHAQNAVRGLIAETRTDRYEVSA